MVITTGTFLGGQCYIGQEQVIQAGRFLRHEEGIEPASLGLAASLKRLKFPIDRLRTGTPPRLDGRTIDYRGLEVQESDDHIQWFSYVHEFQQLPPVNKQIQCFITRTNEDAH